jgi:type I restriction enzyme R subunit
MQAIARVNRVYPGKEGGLVVAYLPLELPLQEALKAYDDEDKEEFKQLQAAAVPVMQEKLEVVRAMFHGFNYRRFLETDDPAERLTVLAKAVNHILAGRERKTQAYIREVTALSNAYALANPLEEAQRIRREVGFFNAVKAALVKETSTGFTRSGTTPQALDALVEKLVSDALVPEAVIPVVGLANMPARTDISILSDEFLAKVQALPERNLAVEMLRRLLEDAIRAGRRRNLIQSQRFGEKLQESVRKYNQEMLTSSQVLEELLRLAAEMREAQRRGEQLGLTEEELAFYDALETNDSAVAILGDKVLREIAQTLVQEVRKNISIDWELREDARARMRVAVKRVLRKYGYPPDKQPKATETVVMQAELLSREWAAG